MARHRSPQSRRAHLRIPLPHQAAAVAGGVLRFTTPVPAPRPSSNATLTRAAAIAVAGSALAAVGQTTLTEALPATSDHDNLLRLGVQKLVGTTPADGDATPAAGAASVRTVVATGIGTAMTPVPAEPRIADVGDLVKAAELRRRAAEAPAATAGTAGRVAVPKILPRREAKGTVRPPVEPAPRGAEVTAKGGVKLVAGRVTSGFGPRWNSQHRGLDIAAPIGTPVRAPLAGTVIDSGPASGFGLWVRVRHADDTVTLYGHIDRSLVRVGEKVTAGQVIAEVGNRGRSTGPHLHIEVITPSGKNLNPVPWLSERAISY